MKYKTSGPCAHCETPVRRLMNGYCSRCYYWNMAAYHLEQAAKYMRLHAGGNHHAGHR